MVLASSWVDSAGAASSVASVVSVGASAAGVSVAGDPSVMLWVRHVACCDL